MPHRNAEVRMLDHGYVREARSLLYHAYRHDPTFAYLFESERPGFDQRVRATVRELVQQHFAEELPAIGLVIEERLVGIALIAPPIRRLDITESWGWRLRMLMTTGFRCTRRYLEYHDAVLACLPPGPYHVLPLIGVHPQFQGQQLFHHLATADQPRFAVVEQHLRQQRTAVVVRRHRRAVSAGIVQLNAGTVGQVTD